MEPLSFTSAAFMQAEGCPPHPLKLPMEAKSAMSTRASTVTLGWLRQGDFDGTLVVEHCWRRVVSASSSRTQGSEPIPSRTWSFILPTWAADDQAHPQLFLTIYRRGAVREISRSCPPGRHARSVLRPGSPL